MPPLQVSQLLNQPANHLSALIGVMERLQRHDRPEIDAAAGELDIPLSEQFLKPHAPMADHSAFGTSDPIAGLTCTLSIPAGRIPFTPDQHGQPG